MKAKQRPGVVFQPHVYRALQRGITTIIENPITLVTASSTGFRTVPRNTPHRHPTLRRPRGPRAATPR